uniref:Sushi domain-containing protein n=1 Tax=Malurus cyaneus samueli TaxID=2593467 RepID=A0A8C5TYZ2_9PASS
TVPGCSQPCPARPWTIPGIQEQSQLLWEFHPSPSPPSHFAELTKESKTKLEFAVGDTVRYSCRPGHSRRPGMPQTLTCLQNHTWSEPCSFPGKQCKYPESPKNGRVVVLTDLLFGSTVNHTCDEGYRMVGQSHRRCEVLGRDVAWTGLPPICQTVECLQPPNITNGRLKGNTSGTFPSGATVSYTCNRGYSLVGNAFINCTVSGVWSQPLPQCKGGSVLCEFPDVQGVKKAIKGNTYRSGTNITLECDDGFMLEGISHTQCQEDFSWDPPVPACKLSEWNGNEAKIKHKHINAFQTCKCHSGKAVSSCLFMSLPNPKIKHSIHLKYLLQCARAL